jgi:hypothetical protein
MKKIIKILMCSWLFCGQVRSLIELTVLWPSGKECQINVDDKPNLSHIFKALGKSKSAEEVLNPMQALQLVNGIEVLTDAACKELPDGAELTLISKDAYFVQSEAVSNRRPYWSESLEKYMMNNEERFVLPVRDGLHMVFYGTNYKTHRWLQTPESELDPETYNLSKWFFSDAQTITNMTIEDKHTLLSELIFRKVHEIELIQKIGSILVRHTLSFAKCTPEAIIGLFTKLLELQTTDELITNDQLPEPQYSGHKWIQSQKEFNSTYELFQTE